MNLLGKGATQPGRLIQPPSTRPIPNNKASTIIPRAGRNRYPGRDLSDEAQIEEAKAEIRQLAVKYRQERDAALKAQNESMYATRALIRQTRIRNKVFATMKDGSPKGVQTLWMKLLVSEIIFDGEFGPENKQRDSSPRA